MERYGNEGESLILRRRALVLACVSFTSQCPLAASKRWRQDWAVQRRLRSAEQDNIIVPRPALRGSTHGFGGISEAPWMNGTEQGTPHEEPAGPGRIGGYRRMTGLETDGQTDGRQSLPCFFASSAFETLCDRCGCVVCLRYFSLDDMEI